MSFEIFQEGDTVYVRVPAELARGRRIRVTCAGMTFTAELVSRTGRYALYAVSERDRGTLVSIMLTHVTTYVLDRLLEKGMDLSHKAAEALFKALRGDLEGVDAEDPAVREVLRAVESAFGEEMECVAEFEKAFKRRRRHAHGNDSTEETEEGE